MQRLLLLFILAAQNAWPAIAYVSSASAQAATVNITTPSRGNVILVCAHRDGSNTAPSVITGYRTLSAVAGGSTNSWRVMYKVSDGSETATGTATNATSIAAAVYSGVDPNVPIGAITQNSGTGSNPTLTYGAITLYTTRDTSSWVVGCGAGRTITGGLDAPTGMTQRTVATDIHLSDTNGTTTSWSSQTDATTSSTSSGWITKTFELRSKQVTPPSTVELVQHQSSAVGEETLASPYKLYPQFNRPTLANNLLVLGLTHQTGFSVSSVVDDTSTTWTAGASITNGNGNHDTRIYYRAGAPAGIKYITVTFSGAVGRIKFALSEFKGVITSSPVDGTSTGQTTSTQPIKSGSITTTQNGDLIYQYVQDVQQSYISLNNAGGVCIGVAPEGGFVLAHGDILDNSGVQFGVQASSGAIDPGMIFHKVDNANSFNSVTMAFKVDGSGTSPSGMRIVHQITHSVFAAAAEPIQFPSSGNLIVVVATNARNQVNFTGTTDTNGNSYTEIELDITTPQFFYAANATTALDLMMTVTAGASGNFVRVYDIAGANTSPYDTSAWGNGDKNASTYTLTEDLAITPGVSSGITITALAFGTGPVDACTGPSGAITHTSKYSGETDGGNMNFGDSICSYEFSSNATQTWSWTHQTYAQVTSWIAQAATFKAPASGTAKRRRFVVQ